MTAGILSAKGRGNLSENQIEDFLQTDASINQGNSGGPLCDLSGQVLGINAMILGTRVGSFGIGFAIPSNMARRVAEQISKNGHVERATVGVQAQDLTPDLATAFKLDVRAGALVDQVQPDGPASKAGVKPGDVVAAVAGHPVHDRVDLMREILGHDVGQNAQLEIIRGGKHYGTNVTLAARHEEPVAPVPAQQQGVPQVGIWGFACATSRRSRRSRSATRRTPGTATVITDVVARLIGRPREPQGGRHHRGVRRQARPDRRRRAESGRRRRARGARSAARLGVLRRPEEVAAPAPGCMRARAMR